LRQVCLSVALPPSDPSEGLAVVVFNGAQVSDRFRNRQLVIRVKPLDELPPGPAVPSLVKLAGWDREVAVVKVVLKPRRKGLYFHWVARWDSYHGWRESLEDIREGQRAAAAAFLGEIGRGLSIGRPRGTGTFHDADDFLDRGTTAVHEHRRANGGHDPRQADIARRFEVDTRTIRRWTLRAGYPSWGALLASV
jgi:hypothetical protein